MFHHDPLKSLRSVRLIRLIPSTVVGGPIELKLFEVSLDEKSPRKNPYEALSYVWGSPIGTESLSCNGASLLVTPNCKSALRHLRLTDKSRILWIDAICIDQGKTDHAISERNAQVALMGEIYANAERTLCWLGEGRVYTEEVMRRLEQIGSCPSQRGFSKLIDFERKFTYPKLLQQEKYTVY